MVITTEDFSLRSLIFSSSIVSISEEQIQEINDLLYVAGYNNPDNGYYNNIQTIAPNDKLIEFNVNIINDENDFRYNGKYGLNIYRCGNEYCVFVYSASYIDDNIFVDKNRCLGYLLFDTVIEYKKLMNAKSIDIISKYDSNFTINNRGKYNNSVDLLFRRIGQSFEYEASNPHLSALTLVLQEASDSYLVRLFEDTNLCDIQKICKVIMAWSLPTTILK